MCALKQLMQRDARAFAHATRSAAYHNLYILELWRRKNVMYNIKQFHAAIYMSFLNSDPFSYRVNESLLMDIFKVKFIS